MKRSKKKVSNNARTTLPADASHLIADARNDITIPFYSGVLQHADDTLIQRGGGKGLKLYDEIERDTHAFAMLQKRKKALLAREWEIKEASDKPIDIEAAAFCREVIANMPFDRICEELLDATLKGFAVSEIIWKREGQRIVPHEIVTHDQRRFAFDEDWAPRLLTWSDMHKGMALPERKFIVHRFGVKGNNPYGLGLGTRLFWPVLFKREGITFWLHFLEKFAAPTVIGFTPYGTLSDEQRKLLNTLSRFRSRSAITVPIGTDVKFLEASRGGAVTYQDFLTYWDKQISIGVNGETLTTDIGDSGSRAASETHADMLHMLVDSDADLLSGTVREQFLTWLVDYNFPGAGVPSIWRVRPANEEKAASVKKAKAEAATATNDALVSIIQTAATIDDDGSAREYITSFGLTDGLSDEAIDRLVDARFIHTDGGAARDMRKLVNESTAFAALFSGSGKKKDHDHVDFAQSDAVPAIADQLEFATDRHFTRRIDAIRLAFDAPNWTLAAVAVLELAASWSPMQLANTLRDALDLAALQGREAVFLDGEEFKNFAEPQVLKQSFKEQVEFFRQKRIQPTQSWLDVLRGNHDRSFVVAGATDLDMLSDFQSVIAKAIEDGTSLEDFRKDFDRIVAQYGWSYKGDRGWRTRVIFETNIRTSYMAGRLKQMRDPDVVKLRPFWEYRHGETRVPKSPRKHHLAWHGLVLRHDDKWWDAHFPPNDWQCSCGVRTLSLADLKRRGKDGPDQAPSALYKPILDPVTGGLTEAPQGIGYGWDYQPGHLWEQGLVPSAMDDGVQLLDQTDIAGTIDALGPIADLIANAKPFSAKILPVGLSPEDYFTAFLKPFGAVPGRAALFEDKAGNHVPISELLFQDQSGGLKVLDQDMYSLMPLLAEAMIDPDEIWVGISRKVDPSNALATDMMVDHRYIRVDPKTGIQILFKIGQRLWTATTNFNSATKKGDPDINALSRGRSGKLLYRRTAK